MGSHELPGIPGLLDVDLQLLLSDLPALPDFQIAPLRNTAPARHTNALFPFEPLTKASQGPRRDRRADGRGVRQTGGSSASIKPSDVLSARTAKKPNLAISELVERHRSNGDFLQLPSFVSLSVVERSPVPQSSEISHPHKRPRLEADPNSNLVEMNRVLPRPAKKDENKARPVPLLPAMVTGLHEPPPSAGLLPSMSDARLEVSRTNRGTSKMTVKEMLAESQRVSSKRPPEKTLYPLLAAADIAPRETGQKQAESSKDETNGNEGAKNRQMTTQESKDTKSRRPRRKWSEQERLDVQAGVRKHGVGRWKQILSDPAFKFDTRTTVDLKDCYRGFLKESADDHHHHHHHHYQPPSTLSAVAEVSEAPRTVSDSTDHVFIETTSPVVLAQHRKKRQPWTTAEDTALMLGVSRHGFSWSAIHTDPEFSWGNRRATDLRDRVRTLDPEGYKKADIRPFVRKKNKKDVELLAEEMNNWRKAENHGQFEKFDLQYKGIEDNAGTSRVAANHSMLRENLEAQLSASKLKNGTPRDNQAGFTQAEHIGVTLPPLALDDDDGALGWDNRLPPLIEWEDIVV